MSSSVVDIPDGCSSFLDYRNISGELLQDLLNNFLYTNKDKIIKLGVLPVLILAGIFINGLFIFVVYRVQYMRTPTNVYLTSLALSDSLFLFAGIGSGAMQILLSPIKIGEFDTRAGYLASAILTDASYFASLFVVTLVILEKYYAVCHPLKLIGTSGIRRASRNIFIAWIVSLAVATASIAPVVQTRWIACIEWPDDEEFRNIPNSYAKYFSEMYNYKMLMVLLESIPFIVTLFFNAIIYAKLIRALTLQVEIMDTHAQNTTHIRNLAIRMLVINGSVYFLLLAPFEVGILVREVLVLTNSTASRSLKETISIIVDIGNYLIYINTVVNPIIYFITNQRYRKAYRIALCGSTQDIPRSSRVVTIESPAE